MKVIILGINTLYSVFYFFKDTFTSEEVGSGHVITQAVYIVPIEKRLMLFQGDERKEDCTLLGKVKLNAFRPSTSSNPWVIGTTHDRAPNCKQVVPRASVEDSDNTCQIRIHVAIGALSQTY